MKSEIFRIYLPITSPLIDDRKALRGFWEATVIEQGGKPVAGGVTVRRIGRRVMVAGRAERS
jgi:hypothetical protein